MGTQAPRELAKINIESDYSKFKFMGGNREIDYNHVKRLKNEMQYNPGLLEAAPVLVNEHMYIVDGQHRFEAAKELKMPIYYMTKPGLSIETARHMNVTQKRWTIMDFAKSFADSGKTDYIFFLRAVKKYPAIAPSIIMKYLAGGQRNALSTDFRRGNFKIENIDLSTDYLERLNTVIQKAHIATINTPMATALLQMFKSEENGTGDFELTKLLRKLDHDGAKQAFVLAGSVRNCLRSIEDVYNFMSNSRVRLY